MRPHRWPWATSLLIAITLGALVAAPMLPPLPRLAGSGGTASDAEGHDSGERPGFATAVSDDWPADAVIYHVFLDRFADGDTPNQQISGPSDDVGYAASLTDWMGGDLAGVRARLDHIVSTGANTVWLSPVTPGPYFHGYHPTDLTDVDPRFGDVDTLRALVADAHAVGLKVVYDLVLNHTSDQHPWFVEAQADCDGSDRVAWYRFRECPDRYAAFAGLPELPQLDLDHPPARAWLIDEVLPFWLADIGVDGLRLDHVLGPSRDFWTFFDAEVEARWPGTLLLAEVWSQQATIDTYGGVMDAATAFPLRDRLEAVFARGGNVRAIAQPVAQRAAESRGPRDATYLSSHDQPRITHLAGGDQRATALAYAAILTMPGLPTIYYGDEIGHSQSDALPDGADFADRWFREPMPWDTSAWDTELFDLVATLARLRTTTPALHSGDYVELVGEGDMWVFERRHLDDRVLIMINLGEDPAGFDVAGLGLVEDGVALTDLLAETRSSTVNDQAAGLSGRVEVGGRDVAVFEVTEIGRPER